jgi:protein O-GlcNAc transferase
MQLLWNQRSCPLRSDPQTMAISGRNDPCPCGSGNKFKRCCGLAKPGASRTGDPGRSARHTLIALKEEVRRANHRGIELAMQGEIAQAVVQFERALSLQPDCVDALNNLGNLHLNQGGAEQAVALFEKALSVRESYAEAHSNLGLALTRQGHLSRATVHFERALLLRPGDFEIRNNLGVTLLKQGRIERAVASFEQVLSQQPDHVVAHGNLAITLNYSAGRDPEAVSAVHRNFASKLEPRFAHAIKPHPNLPVVDRRLAIGYVSSDLRQHSVAHFMEPVMAHHDHAQFAIICYFNSRQEDEVTARLRSHADHWRNIHGKPDDVVADQIRADGIDILLDLNGHMEFHRLPVFARKPAPIQATWLGYPNTTGLATMDYRLTDAFADPVGMTEHLHSEQLVRLPQCFSCYQAPRDAPEVSPLPAREKGYVTFGSFNNLAKITPEVMKTWARIVLALPGSHLHIKNSSLGDEVLREKVRAEFASMGLPPDCLELSGHDRSQKSHLANYGSVDIALDPFPYNGATTTCDALWMGVPVVTLAGRMHAGRVGVSQLSNLGLIELIGNTLEEYIAAAARLAGDLQSLGELRSRLRAAMIASPLMDAPRFTRNLEQIYRTVWTDWCRKATGTVV